MYAIVTLVGDAPESTEPLGTKDKFWYEGGQFLFKQVRPGTGEDWSEKVCAELAEYLGLPHAEYDLAEWHTEGQVLRGVRSRNFCAPGTALILGNELLAEVDPSYPAVASVSNYRVPAHTVDRVLSTLRLRELALPIGWTPPPFVETAVDAFIGYLSLDALVGNTDRHHENWGVLRSPNGQLHLAPTFDHASSLGRNLRDNERAERLQTHDQNRTVEAFAKRAKSALFRTESDLKPQTALSAFLEAARFSRAAAQGWLDVIRTLRDTDAAIIVKDVPPDRISHTALEFACRLISINRDNLLASREELG
jgi:hypothetical protein